MQHLATPSSVRHETTRPCAGLFRSGGNPADREGASFIRATSRKHARATPRPVGRAMGHATLAGECPPAPACGRPLLLYFAHKRSASHRVHNTSDRSKFRCLAVSVPRASTVEAGGPLGKIKEEGVAAKRRPGDICLGAYRPLRGPHACGISERRQERPGSRATRVRRASSTAAHGMTGPSAVDEEPKKNPGACRGFSCLT
ncbi:hypothetical protein M2412_001878 [Stenotrophomonas rhizophila]|uniref:Uncharacterized protein n=1 Tax=Stenotrophomonas rhizophila TaxID=216778 RepID=A0AAW5PIT8_9GAMM|nr:hypothetical protein [Stenotrophomonas rhizophila]